jgi:hypothetical protein
MNSVVDSTEPVPVATAVPTAVATAIPVDGDSAALVRRVERLEKSVVELQDTAALEERVYQRVAARMPGNWLGKFNPFRPRAIAPVPIESGWLLWDMLTEARFIAGMIFDSRFAMTWASRLILIAAVLLIIASGFWNPLTWIPILGTWIDKLTTLVIGFFIFKVLTREAQRYRAFLQSLSAA